MDTTKQPKIDLIGFLRMTVKIGFYPYPTADKAGISTESYLT